MNATVLLTAFQARSIKLMAVDGELEFEAPLGELTDEDMAALRDLKAELLPVLEARQAASAAVAWRGTAMRPQGVPSGAALVLTARPDLATPATTGCLSCGNPLPPGRTYRCAPCQAAAEKVLAPLGGPR